MRLQEYRKRLKMTLDACAERFGISRATLWRIENQDDYAVTLDHALALFEGSGGVLYADLFKQTLIKGGSHDNTTNTPSM